MCFPQGARFAFTIMDDTDVATVENVAPIYRLLETLGFRTTKTVWPFRCDDPESDFAESETLDDPHYLEFAIDLQRRGFEIAFHGATMESSTREQTRNALTRFASVFGASPLVHANHSFNRENLYWGSDRLDDRMLRRLYSSILRLPARFYQGHEPGSEYWWGDLCLDHIRYVRNLTFDEINVLRVNPSMPYRDSRRPYVQWWFSASDAEDADAFVALLNEANQQRLESEGGVCVVATHLGKGFCTGGQVRADVRHCLTTLAGRGGWCVPVGTLLDYLRDQREESTLMPNEWRRMQWRWARDLVGRRVADWQRKRAGSSRAEPSSPTGPAAPPSQPVRHFSSA